MTKALLTDTLRRRLAVWLAVLVVAFGALAPVVSHALVAARGTALSVEICTNAGARWVAPADEQPVAIAGDGATLTTEIPTGQQSVSAVAHCPFCLLSADHGMAPPHQTPYLFFVKGDPERPIARQAFFFYPRFLLLAAPRGPPDFNSPIFMV